MSANMNIFNATRHRQDSFRKEWNDYGATFVPTYGPQISSVRPSASVKDLMYEADEAIEKALLSGADTILVGGITGLGMYIAMKARLKGLRVIEPMFSGRVDRHLRFIGIRDLTDGIDELAIALREQSLGGASIVKEA